MFGDPDTILNRWPTKKLGELLDFLTSGSRGWAKHYADAGLAELDALFASLQHRAFRGELQP